MTRIQNALSAPERLRYRYDIDTFYLFRKSSVSAIIVPLRYVVMVTYEYVWKLVQSLAIPGCIMGYLSIHVLLKKNSPGDMQQTGNCADNEIDMSPVNEK